LFWLCPESEQRVSFVVCFGYIQSLKEEWVLLFVLFIYRAWNTLLFQSLYITKTNNKAHTSFRLCI
jgi:hypothetical protein